jgi:hypothetical protein
MHKQFPDVRGEQMRQIVRNELYCDPEYIPPRRRREFPTAILTWEQVEEA